MHLRTSCPQTDLFCYVIRYIPFHGVNIQAVALSGNKAPSIQGDNKTCAVILTQTSEKLVNIFETKALKNIPVMFDVHDQTIGAWVHDDAGLEPDVALEELAEEAPAPEKKGEFAKLLKGSGLTTDWIDGYLTSVVIAPEMIAPNRFLSPVLGPVMPELDPSKFQRFMDLLMMRAHAASDLSADADEFATVMAKRPRKALADWATGFTLAAREFRAAWPKKSMTPEDRWLLEIVADGPDATDMAEIGVLLAGRQERNQP